DRNRSHWSTSKTPSYTKSVSWQHHRVCDEFMVANSELFALVQEYNRIASTCGMDELRITHLG
ncbi:hypothetical protein PO558_22100, partial [Escherichia coli]